MGKLTRRTAPRIAAHNGQLTTTSRDIAETFGKEHKDVVRRINALQCSAEFRSAHFYAHPYTLEQNGETYTEYLVTKDGFAFLCMGFTGAKAAAWKEKYIAHFNRMADQLAKKKQKRPLPGIHPAQSAIKQIAHDPASMIGKGLPPVPASVGFSRETRDQIDQAVLQQAMQLMPALRSYLERRVAYHARNTHGWMPELIAPTIAQASLADALNYEATSQLRGLAITAAAVESATTRLHAEIKDALKADGLLSSGAKRIV